MSRLYLAASFNRAEEMRGYRDELRGLGHHVTSRWIDVGGSSMREEEVLTNPSIAQGHAVDNIADIMSADAMLMFTGVPSTTGGRHVEFGVALMIGKQVIIIGPRENVFQVYQGVDQFDTWTKFIDQVRSISASSSAQGNTQVPGFFN